jgi:4-hydroxybenzoate polyprenyltransferase
MRLSAALRLGRVSNQPTVWTNVLAGVVLAGGGSPLAVCGLIAGIAVIYTAGMFLNDAFDAEFDCAHRPERPIPSGEATLSGVFASGFLLMAIGLVLIVGTAAQAQGAGAASAFGSGVALAAVIVLYDWWHKENAFGPLLMGVCRMLAYVTAALAVSGSVNAAVIGAAVVALCYLIGLTYIAKQETLGRMGNLWPLIFLAAPFIYEIRAVWRHAASAAAFVALLVWVLYALSFLRVGQRAIGKAVGYLIAGICLMDALFVSEASPSLALLAAAAFVLTLCLHRVVPGT